MDVSNPETIKLAEYFIESLLKNSISKYINVNLDEPFELGRGKTSEIANKIGKGNLYLDYMQKIYDICKKYNKTMLMWGDVIFHYPDIISKLPEDIVILDWSYEGDASFEEHSKIMYDKENKFCLCPGTSVWATFTGRSDNMIKNITDAVLCAQKYKAAGVIVTDWGDLGHWQYQIFSYPAIAYAAVLMWNDAGSPMEYARDFCNRLIFKDDSELLFDLLIDMGNYYKLENAPIYSTSLCFSVMSSKYRFSSAEEFKTRIYQLLKTSANLAAGSNFKIPHEDIRIEPRELFEYLTGLENRVGSLKITVDDADILLRELRNAIKMVKHGLKLYCIMTGNKEVTSTMKELFDNINDILKEHYNLWVSRNRRGGFARSTAQMQHLAGFYYNSIN
jgi:hypothetical protein